VRATDLLDAVAARIFGPAIVGGLHLETTAVSGADLPVLQAEPAVGLAALGAAGPVPRTALLRALVDADWGSPRAANAATCSYRVRVFAQAPIATAAFATGRVVRGGYALEGVAVAVGAAGLIDQEACDRVLNQVAADADAALTRFPTLCDPAAAFGISATRAG
jgi:hypothetical protein